eukprot:TRINITY_DN6879_c0_g1_i3.p1 TRINITY_DN6879_c0_g1~~TRINITY_DN6879_c0_g1_i3.p1  ORF type:complete len:150 (+),score=33.24 TRINITY_DN6879_c0_g1_i3:39-488(+)
MQATTRPLARMMLIPTLRRVNPWSPRSMFPQGEISSEFMGRGISFSPPRLLSSMKIDPRLHLSYTCKVCSTRNAKTISKQAYTKGVVIVTCEGCSNRHLIADHLGWWKELSDKGIHDIEDILREKGESVRKVLAVGEKDFEAVPTKEES